MTKKNFVTLLLSTVGGLLFALGMCMTMLPEWDLFQEGVVIGCVGLAVLLLMVLIRRKMEGKPLLVPLSAKTVAAIFLSIFGALLLGFGMCLVMVWEQMVYGILIGTAGIVLLICLIPLVKGLK